MKKFVLLFLSVILSVFANDGFGALGAGGIIVGKTNDIAMAKEVLDISYDKIKVDYEFVNEGDKDITETIVFPLPSYLIGAPNAYYDWTIPDFKVFVDGKPIKFNTTVRAVSYMTNKDITNDLRKAGLSDYEIASFEDYKISAKKKNALLKAGLLTKECVENGDCELLWYCHVTYEWTQTFKAKQTLKVLHEYKALPSMGANDYYNYFDGNGTKSSREKISKDYCADSKTLDKLDSLVFTKDKNSQHGYYPRLMALELEYILKTANTWKDGIRDFKLIVRKGKANEVISLCFPGNFKKTSPLAYEVEIKNFKPQQNLKVYFGNVDNEDFSFQPESKPPIFQK